MTTGRQPDPAVDALLPLVYDELRRLAAAYLRRERPGQTLQPTALVHEAYLRLLKDKPGPLAEPGALLRHRRALDAADPDRAGAGPRRAEARRRPGRASRSTKVCSPPTSPHIDLVALDEALQRLEAIDPEQARLVELRFFGGLTIEETAEAMNISARHGQAALDRRARLARARARGPA